MHIQVVNKHNYGKLLIWKEKSTAYGHFSSFVKLPEGTFICRKFWFWCYEQVPWTPDQTSWEISKFRNCNQAMEKFGLADGNANKYPTRFWKSSSWRIRDLRFSSETIGSVLVLVEVESPMEGFLRHRFGWFHFRLFKPSLVNPVLNDICERAVPHQHHVRC